MAQLAAGHLGLGADTVRHAIDDAGFNRERARLKRIEPFSFWPAYASAIPGFGGNDAGPDPFYCFHTPYTEFAPGHVAFHLRLSGARATMGELALRVHAYRSDQSSDAMMVSGTRQRLDNLDDQDVDLSVRFLALPGVGYALFGRYSEPADLSVGAIEIAAEELGDVPGMESGAVAVSARADDGAFTDINKLCSDGMPSILHPVSQPCTRDQIDSAAFASLWPMIPAPGGDPVVRWSMVVPLQVLDNAGMLKNGSKGLIINAPDPALGAVLRDRGCAVVERSGAGISGEVGGDCDFAVTYAMSSQDGFGEAGGFSPEQSIGQVLKGGLAITLSSIDSDPHKARNAAQQIALRLIGRGHGIAQICIPADSELIGKGEGDGGTMAVIAQR
jgi:hypothetical protein